ncbi:hypothetical protein [Peptostreptococcus equinus]|uniref:DUF1516 family protein n=1 Tax=Peptostreptococcus equinus TaxID=3003601 RepID=A0ABY7JUV1_9FIRM|nr:hypothetical protein [Peptostreptococcus sp. CBA3647]WAW15677.1 hypothetical protein O0R46_04305 [Peptostreptococcus sp. CBA3647]
MSILGLIILLIFSGLAIYSLLAKGGRGVKNYIIRNFIGTYIFIISLLAIMKSSYGIAESLYLGIFSILAVISCIVIAKRDVKSKYSKMRVIYIVGIIVATISIYMSYIN